MSKIIVLGAGMVGSAIAMDLSAKHEVTSADVNRQALDLIKDKVQTIEADLSDKGVLSSLLKDFDLVVSAVPGFLGFETLKTAIEAGKDIVDISFFPENALDLNELAISKGVTAIVDIGVAPGMDNIILGYYDSKMEVEDFECLVGGLPKTRAWPFEYKAPFSPVDVIEEYTRPARYMENGHIVTKPAMSDTELINFEEAGTLESFNSDGLRSLLFTMPHIPNMKEKTLRYPGHIKLIQALRDAGFFHTEKITHNNMELSPLDFTSKMLIDQWKLHPGEKEFTIMRVTVKGKMNGKTKEIIYHLYDELDEKSGFSSMARTTGFTCTAAVNLVLEDKFRAKGVFPPEHIGREPQCFEYILEYLKERNVIYRREERDCGS